MRFTLALMAMVAATPVAADSGERLFAPCRACHSLDPAERGLPGPNLSGLLGRTVGGDPNFDYSPTLKKARSDELVWDTQRLDTFLADPAEMFPGLWMATRGVDDAAGRRALVQFLSDSASR